MTMLDYVMSAAVRGHYGVDGGVLTVDMSVGFMNAGTSSHILAEGRVLHGGQSTAFCEAEARDEGGKLLAKAIGTFKLLGEKDGAPAVWPGAAFHNPAAPWEPSTRSARCPFTLPLPQRRGRGWSSRTCQLARCSLRQRRAQPQLVAADQQPVPRRRDHDLVQAHVRRHLGDEADGAAEVLGLQHPGEVPCAGGTAATSRSA